jgi:hypothetical protein
MFACTSAMANHKKAKHVVIYPTGSISVANPTSIKYNIRLDGRFVGSVQPHGNLLLTQTPAGKHMIDAIHPGKVNISAQRMRAMVRKGTVAWVRIKQPVGKMQVTNRQGVKTTLFIDGQARSVLRSGTTSLISNIPVGRHHVELMGSFGSIAETTLFVSAQQRASWSPSKRVGTIRIRNSGNSGSVLVQVDQKTIGYVSRGRSLKISGVPIGMRQVEIISKSGRSAVRTLHVRPSHITAWTYAPRSPKSSHRVAVYHGGHAH